MYEYRRLTPQQKQAVLRHRRLCDLPLHAPPHYPAGKKQYIISAACFEHQPFMQAEPRRSELQERLIGGLADRAWATVHAWVVLPNHYHLLASVDLAPFREWIRLLHSAVATEWNKQDRAKGRKVWYRFSDRAIRTERHYCASLNYIHANPVKHGYVAKADEWPCSSIHIYLAEYGREALVKQWNDYPVDDYGKDWDW
jgi:putative transposase